jgi:hypothetical protein
VWWEQQVPPLRSPEFPVKPDDVDTLHAPFPYRKAHTRSCSVQRGRRSGYAPVGMTPLFRVLSRQERYIVVVEVPALKRSLLRLNAGAPTTVGRVGSSAFPNVGSRRGGCFNGWLRARSDRSCSPARGGRFKRMSRCLGALKRSQGLKPALFCPLYGTTKVVP